MDKKQLQAIVDGVVKEVATANKLEEMEARTLVGIMIRRNKEVFVRVAVSPTLRVVEDCPAS